jgi:hypothetical protein
MNDDLSLHMEERAKTKRLERLRARKMGLKKDMAEKERLEKEVAWKKV